MIPNDLPGLWQYVGTLAVALGLLAGLVTSIGVLAKSPLGHPIRWLFRRVVAEPVGDWFQRLVLAATAALTEKVNRIDKELHPNGGSSFRDEVRRQMETVAQQMETVNEFMVESSTDRASLRRENEAFHAESRADRAALHRQIGALEISPFDHLDRLAASLGREHEEPSSDPES